MTFISATTHKKALSVDLLAGLGILREAEREEAVLVAESVYIINVTWSDSTSQTIYRRYSKFFDLQIIKKKKKKEEEEEEEEEEKKHK
ncbi:SH3 and PX domain-containing protein 2A [Myotis brandtii]|uniref:SH3 and PX domain-containing protein 2A n=1 Tax=Myotis brandtii TaxID=109478 RepID=S7Q2R3_MYOBR|nr:SH3 and PX domain-containing protein 2A [Myotis brandtii]